MMEWTFGALFVLIGAGLFLGLLTPEGLVALGPRGRV